MITVVDSICWARLLLVVFRSLINKKYMCGSRRGIGGPSDSFTILGLWVLGLAVSHRSINESQLQITIFHDKSAIPLHPCWYKSFASQRKHYAQKMQDAQVIKITGVRTPLEDHKLYVFQKKLAFGPPPPPLENVGIPLDPWKSIAFSVIKPLDPLGKL